ncbi:hypothetical protein MNBD_GAMMA22-1251 [hydrothermal vent metagenome]|uniref:Uncharacterized protein n=1 Tax=hydrothermal vent metagenome TaxID=652676 RepID=A0A3B1ABC1_9ZZZZ
MLGLPNLGDTECAKQSWQQIDVARNVCPIFPDNDGTNGEDESIGNWSECVRQCLQERHKNRMPKPKSCSPDNNIGSEDNADDHAMCFIGCGFNSENPYNPIGKDLPNRNPSLD